MIQLFDIYLDLRQKRKYLNLNLPEQFFEGYRLSDEVDLKHKKGKYEPKKESSPTDQEGSGSSNGHDLLFKMQVG